MLLQEMTWPEIQTLIPDTPVVVPVAALEQHGHHLPVFTDSMLVGEVTRRAEAELQSQALFTPVMWLGNSHHHLEFAGTMSAAPRTYLDLLGSLVESLLHHGFRRILFVNGHGGNMTPGQQVIFEIRQRHRQRDDLLLLFSSYWELAEPDRSRFTQPRMGHAGEWETSMILRLAPHLVKPYQDLADVPFGTPFEPAYRGWITRDRTETGHIGNPAAATPEKGEHLFAAYAAGLVAMVQRMRNWDGASWNG